MEDHSIIEKVLRGDIEQFSFLVDKYKDLVFSIAYRIMENQDDAKDVLQDTFVKAFKALKSYRKESKFSNWLYRIAYTTAISKKRTFKFNIDYLDAGIDPVDLKSLDSIYSELERNDRHRLIESVLNKLNTDERLLISLHYFNDCSVEEIALITGLSTSNTKVKMFRIRKKLYHFIKKYYSEIQEELI